MYPHKSFALPFAGLLLPFLAGGFVTVCAQQPSLRGQVVEQGSGAAVEGALVSLYDASYAQRASALSDADGSFTLSRPAPGAYTLQASGGGLLSTPVRIEVSSAGAALEEVVLVVPSRLALLAGGCREAERAAGTGIVVGTVRDASSGVPLPGARVVLRWGEGEGSEEVQTIADDGGRYRFCAAPAGAGLTVRAQLLHRVSPDAAVPMARPALVRQDLAVAAASTPAVEVERVRRPGLAEGPGSLGGRLTDAESGEAIAGAVLTLRGGQRTPQQLSDAAGAFQFENLTPGAYTLEVQRLGYGVQRQEIEVPGSSDVEVALGLTAEAVTLEGVAVSTRTPMEERLRVAPGSRYAVSEAEINAMNVRGARMADLIRTRIPALKVWEGTFTARGEFGPVPMLCIESSRGPTTLSLPSGPSSFPFCDMVTVYVDGIRIPGAGSMLRGMQLADFAEVEYLSPVEAGVMYGLGSQSGVLLLTTRGRTPGAPD